jgi:hypothetical protein
MHHFQLVTPDGESLGTVDVARPGWPPGSVIYRGGSEPNLRVVSNEPGDPAVLIVELIRAAQRGG